MKVKTDYMRYTHWLCPAAISIGRYDTDPRIDLNQLELLKQSITAHGGIFSPIVVLKKNGFATRVTGRRRLMAAQQLDLYEIPAYIIEDENLADLIRIDENLIRTDLSPEERITLRLKQIEVMIRMKKPKSVIMAAEAQVQAEREAMAERPAHPVDITTEMEENKPVHSSQATH